MKAFNVAGCGYDSRGSYSGEIIEHWSEYGWINGGDIVECVWGISAERGHIITLTHGSFLLDPPVGPECGDHLLIL